MPAAVYFLINALGSCHAFDLSPQSMTHRQFLRWFQPEHRRISGSCRAHTRQTGGFEIISGFGNSLQTAYFHTPFPDNAGARPFTTGAPSTTAPWFDGARKSVAGTAPTCGARESSRGIRPFFMSLYQPLITINRSNDQFRTQKKSETANHACNPTALSLSAPHAPTDEQQLRVDYYTASSIFLYVFSLETG